MIARFDLYDFVANLIPGLVFLWCVQVLAALFSWTLPLDFTGGLAETSILLVLGYITGLLLQGLSQGIVEKRILLPLWRGFPSERWLLPDDDHFSAAYKARLLSLIAERFKVATDPDLPSECPPDRERKLRLKKNRELLSLIYHHMGVSSPRPITFNARYGLFRALLTMFALLTTLALGGVVWALCRQPVQLAAFAMWTGLFAGAALIADLRCRKRSEDFAQSVFDLFMAGAGGKPPSEKPT